MCTDNTERHVRVTWSVYHTPILRHESMRRHSSVSLAEKNTPHVLWSCDTEIIGNFLE